MTNLQLNVLSLRYSSWSMRPWLVLTHTGAQFTTSTVELPHMHRQGDDRAGSAGLAFIEADALTERRALGSVRGLFPVLWVDDVPVHESLAICEYVADAFPDAQLWPEEPLLRAQARAISCEMCTGFLNLRGELSSHLFGRVPAFEPSAAATADIERVFEIWSAALNRSGGPFLFGTFGIADAMYYPVLTRLYTYGVPIPIPLQPYAHSLQEQPAVQKLVTLARSEPHIPIYDDYLKGLGGDPDAGLASDADQ